MLVASSATANTLAHVHTTSTRMSEKGNAAMEQYEARPASVLDLQLDAGDHEASVAVPLARRTELPAGLQALLEDAATNSERTVANLRAINAARRAASSGELASIERWLELVATQVPRHFHPIGFIWFSICIG